MQVKERLDLVAGIPRQVFAAPGFDPLEDVQAALSSLKWDDVTTGFTPEQVGFPHTASHRLLMISTPEWKSGKLSSLMIDSTANLRLQSVRSPPPAHRCHAGDFKTKEVMFRSFKIGCMVEQQIRQRSAEQQRIFLSASDDQTLPVSDFSKHLYQQAVPQPKQAGHVVACCADEAT